MPALMTCALVGFVTVAVGLVTSISTFRFGAVSVFDVFLPPIHAHLFSLLATCVVAKIVISGLTKKITRFSIIMFGT